MIIYAFKTYLHFQKSADTDNTEPITTDSDANSNETLDSFAHNFDVSLFEEVVGYQSDYSDCLDSETEDNLQVMLCTYMSL